MTSATETSPCTRYPGRLGEVSKSYRRCFSSVLESNHGVSKVTGVLERLMIEILLKSTQKTLYVLNMTTASCEIPLLWEHFNQGVDNAWIMNLEEVANRVVSSSLHRSSKVVRTIPERATNLRRNECYGFHRDSSNPSCHTPATPSPRVNIHHVAPSRAIPAVGGT